VAESKISQFAQGALRKSKKDKEKDAEDRKAREEEAKAAQVLAEYVDAFESEGAASARRRAGGGGFVRAGGSDSGSRRYDSGGRAESASTSRTANVFEQMSAVRLSLARAVLLNENVIGACTSSTEGETSHGRVP
jgi:hypothetical protein